LFLCDACKPLSALVRRQDRVSLLAAHDDQRIWRGHATCSHLHQMRDERGFTLNELLVTVGILMVASVMATVTFASAPVVRANSQAQRLVELLQDGRETAIARQREVDLELDAVNRRARLMLSDGVAPVILREVVFENGIDFLHFAGHGDTPDAFGDGAAIAFDGASRLVFIPTGSLVDEDAAAVDGTMFIAIPGKRDTARAITVVGATARVRLYSWSGREWTE
jgi:type II secretory pathway pseudopilin PulG